MGNLFGKKKKQESRVTDEDRAVLQLKQQRDKLKQYQKKIVVTLQKDRECAKELLRDGKKDKAKLLLRKKKFQEGLMQKTDGQLENIERMVHDLEFAQIESKVVEGLKAGNAALKKMHELMSLEDVEKIMDETQESVEYQREIDALLAGGLSQEDEDDVLQELDDIVKESIPSLPDQEEAEKPEEDVQLPDVPREKIPKKDTREAVLAS